MNKNFYKTIALTVILMLLLSGCAEIKEAGVPAEGETFVFEDALGREVAVKSHKRVAILLGSFAQVWSLAGGEKQIVACVQDAWEDYDLSLGDEVINIGKVNSPSLEKVLESNPDFIIASANTSADVDLLGAIEKTGITAAYFNVSSFDDYLSMLDICTSITGDRECYEKYGTQVKKQIEQVKGRITGEKPSVMYVRAAGSVTKIKGSRDSVLGEMLKDLDCINIADNEENLLENLNLETILKEDPEFIFVVYQGSDEEKANERLDAELLSNPAWAQLSAVKSGKVFVLEKDLYNQKPNTRWGEAYEKLADIIYP